MQIKKLGLTLCVTLATACAGAQSLGGERPAHTSINSNYNKLPLTFEANRGQTDPSVKFVSRGPGYRVFLTSDGMVLSLRANRTATGDAAIHPSKKARLQLRLLGTSKNPSVVGEVPQAGRGNYFIGNDPGKWRRNVPTYNQVRYKNIYPGIDLLYYGNQRQLEYDFAIAPGAEPERIQFEVSGASDMHIDANGSLILTTGIGELHIQTPQVYQESKGQRIPVEGGYVVSDPTHVGFQVAKYDRNSALLIDPVLVYSTYLGGSSDDQVSGIAVDAAGSIYVAGSTDSMDFPLPTLGSLPDGNTHAFIAKLDASGSNLVYADYLGGNSQDYGYALALDSANNIYVTGGTASSDFPVVNPFQGTYPGGFDVFLSKISPDGSSLLYSTYFGGSGSNFPSSVAIDGVGEMVIAGYTSSTTFPVANAYQPTVSANQGGAFGNYGFLTKFTTDGLSLVYSTYLAGSSNVPLNCGGTPCWSEPTSVIKGMVLDTLGNAYVTGTTNTYNFPVTQGSYQTTDSTQGNGSVGFVSKFSGSGNLQYSTYFYDATGVVTDPTAIAVDRSGSAYITGAAITFGTFPITSTTICDPGVYGFGCNYAFVTKFDATAATLLYSTFLGPNNNAVPQAIVLDGSNDAYILAYTGGGSFSTVNGIENFSGGNDILLVEIDPAASTQPFATYLGGSGNDQPAPAGMVLDADGNFYIAGTTDSTDFPVTQHAFQSGLGGQTDGFILKIAPDSSAAVTFSPSSLQYASQMIGTSSQPQTAVVRNIGSAPLSISSISTSGDFAETDNCGNSVSAAGSCTLSVTFTPTAPGARSGGIVIVDDAAGTPHNISLSGSALGAIVALTPTSLTFPSVLVGTPSAAQALTLTNSGNATLSISTISMTGDYSESDNCSTVLAAGSSCSIQVIFTPTGSGMRSGSVTVTDNVTGSPQSVALTGTGIALSANAVLTPSSLTFASVPLGTSSLPQTVTLTNSGNTALTLSTVYTTGDYGQTDNCPASLSAGSTCVINVTFTPTVTGTRTGTVTISDSAMGSPQSVALTGTGIALSANAVLTPSSLTFASVPLGTSSLPQTVTLTNSGNTALTISGVQVTGDYGQNNNCPASLSAGSTCTINVTFTPTVTGTRTGTVTISDSAMGSPQIVALTGTGLSLSATVALTPSSLTFASVPRGTSSTSQMVTLTNTGNAALTLSTVYTTGDYGQTDNCPASLSAGSSCTINVTFTPTVTGARTGTVTISDNAAGSPHIVGLSGTGSDFSLNSSSSSTTVKAGMTASYSLTVASVGGTFSNAVKLSCSGAPATTNCSLSAGSVTPGSSSAVVTVTISTTATSAELVMPRSAETRPIYALWMQFPGFGFVGLMVTGSKRRAKKFVVLIALLLLVAALLLMSACSGGTGIAPQHQGTTPGTYTITVSGTSGSLQHSVPLTLTVQ